MFDPVTAEDGVTYDRTAIEKWLAEHDTSPMVREGQRFRTIGKGLEPNRERKAAIDRVLRDYNHDDEPETVEWDTQGLQSYLPGEGRSVVMSSPTSIVPPPSLSPRAVADMTSDLTHMFKILDPLRGELKSLGNLTPPKVGKSGSALTQTPPLTLIRRQDRLTLTLTSALNLTLT